MLNFLKKLFLSNKYSLLVLLILALWLKLVKDYNILLSYLVLIVLYLFVGIIVEMVLERFFPGFNAPRHAERRREERRHEEAEEEELSLMESVEAVPEEVSLLEFRASSSSSCVCSSSLCA